MKKRFFQIFTFIFIIFWLSYSIPISYADVNNVNIGVAKWSPHQSNDKLDTFWSDDFYSLDGTGEKAIYRTLVRVARDLKNLFFILSSIYFFIMVFQVLFSGKTQDSINHLKKGIIWITIGLVIMQLAYVFTRILYDGWVSEQLAGTLLENLINPLIKLIQTLASLFFMGIAFYAFYRLVTANGDDTKAEQAKKGIIEAIIWFVIIKFAKLIVEATYGTVHCQQILGWFITFTGWGCIQDANLSWFSAIIVQVINWANSLIWIVVVIMIIFAWFQVFISWGKEDALKKARTSLTYIAIGLVVLVTNYLILTFFILPESPI
jgi:hypothetical protein